MKSGSKVEVPDYYVMPTDGDFSGTTNGTFQYIGTDEYVIIPNVIKGVVITKTNKMFKEKAISGVANLDDNIVDATNMFHNSPSTGHLELCYFSFANLEYAESMFRGSKFSSLDLDGFEAPNISKNNNGIGNMFYFAQNLTEIDISKFNTTRLNVGFITNTFKYSAKTVYVRSLADKTKLLKIQGSNEVENWIIR